MAFIGIGHIHSPFIPVPAESVAQFGNPLLLALACATLAVCFLLYMRVRLAAHKQQMLREQKNQYKKLLLSIFPAKVAAELVEKGHVEAKRHEEVSILFTDFAGYTAYSATMRPMQLVRELDEIFSMFDSIILHRNVEKIKTIGDSYLCVAGLPEPSPTHAEDILQVALEFVEFIAVYRHIKKQEGIDFPNIRIGIHTGPVVAGVIGVSKTAYDVWGDTVNVAKRMEQASEDGKINVSEMFYLKIKDKSRFVPRESIEIKGKGLMEMYFVKDETGTDQPTTVPDAAEIHPSPDKERRHDSPQ